MTCAIKTFGLSSSLKQESVVTKGIVSILGAEPERLKVSSNSLRRTLSADMSSRKWLSQHGLKKIASSENFLVSITEYSSSSSSLSDGEEEDYDLGQGSNKKSQFESENQSQFDIWSSIIQQKKLDDSNNVPPTYVHPLVRRSSSSLSEKSLQICTESLGSESGSDGFSSYTPSETSDSEDEKAEQPQQKQAFNVNSYDVEEEVKVVKYNKLPTATKRSTQSSFPPPISSLSSHCDGTSLLMKSRRDNGRLVLEAVSVSSPNKLRAERQDGRLVLTLINGPKDEKEEEVVENKENEVDQFEVELEDSKDEKELEDEDDDAHEEDEDVEVERGRGVNSGGGETKFVMEQAPKLGGGIINVHRLATMVDKTIMLANKNTLPWTNQAKFEQGSVEEVVKPSLAMTQSLPPRPPLARMIPSAPKMMASPTTAKPGTVSFNPYEYYWKSKVTSPTTVPKTTNLNSEKHNLMTKNSRNNLNRMLYIVQNCKEQRRSVLCQESYCIATS